MYLNMMTVKEAKSVYINLYLLHCLYNQIAFHLNNRSRMIQYDPIITELHRQDSPLLNQKKDVPIAETRPSKPNKSTITITITTLLQNSLKLFPYGQS